VHACVMCTCVRARVYVYVCAEVGECEYLLASLKCKSKGFEMRSYLCGVISIPGTPGVCETTSSVYLCVLGVCARARVCVCVYAAPQCSSCLPALHTSEQNGTVSLSEGSSAPYKVLDNVALYSIRISISCSPLQCVTCQLDHRLFCVALFSMFRSPCFLCFRQPRAPNAVLHPDDT